MKYLKQFLIILAFCLLGELLAAVIPLPIPAAIYGLVLLLIALSTGLLKAQAISDTANFLIRIMPILFVAPAANILQHWGIIAPNVVPIVAISVLTTFLVFAVSGLATKWLLKKKGGGENG
jgi:holin-like protein